MEVIDDVPVVLVDYDLVDDNFARFIDVSDNEYGGVVLFAQGHEIRQELVGVWVREVGTLAEAAATPREMRGFDHRKALQMVVVMVRSAEVIVGWMLDPEKCAYVC